MIIQRTSTGSLKLTVPTVTTSRPARASVPKISVISCSSCLVAFASVDLERSCDSFALKQGCRDMWTLEGSVDMLENQK